jgi:tRNA (guanine-N7-)-methyltransferase
MRSVNDSEQPRRIRSFVVRAGRATAAQERALEEFWPPFGIEMPGIETPERELDLDRAFGRSAPRMMEIGFGAGEALLAFAGAHPEFDCLGVEVHRPGVGRLLLRAHADGLGNLKVVCHDAVELAQRSLAPASLDLIHIFFPDPWPKKRHHKRRLIQPEFVALLARVLKPKGILRLATDWENYAMQMREVIDADVHFRNSSADGFAPRTDERPLTRFEQRGQRLGHGVWDLAYERIP